MRWRRAFPGERAQLRVMRQWVQDLLPPCPALDDLVSVVDELAVNAVAHTASGQGGQFSVEVLVTDELARVVVGDQGGPSEPRVITDPQGESGRGLLLVSAISAAMGVSGGADGRLVWADLPWTANRSTALREPAEGQSIAADLRILQERFPGVPIWFGCSTRQWWGTVVTAEDEKLVAAESPAGLAASLTAVYASHLSAIQYGREHVSAVPGQPFDAAAATSGPWPTRAG
jgi:serine/threonine-protein kinase RsbW